MSDMEMSGGRGRGGMMRGRGRGGRGGGVRHDSRYNPGNKVDETNLNPDSFPPLDASQSIPRGFHTLKAT